MQLIQMYLFLWAWKDIKGVHLQPILLWNNCIQKSPDY